MEAVGSAASIIAVLELSAKVATLCFQYSKAVKNAKSDIERLRGELDRLKATLEGAQQLLQSPDGALLRTSQRLLDGLDGCSSLLIELQTKLEKKLEPSTQRKMMGQFGVTALTWPFESKDIDGIITTLARYRDTLSSALTVDLAGQILDINRKLVLSKLPIADDAAFDSHADEHDARCHPETRVALRQDIIRWAEDPQGECIFWLNGMAGTGKSTISRTIAQSFAEKGDLGASFFFKRGERDRGNAARLFTTIAANLVKKVPAVAAHIQAAINTDSAVASKALKEQFEKLILRPLAKLEAVPDKRIVLVIDALDECERDDDIRAIIYLLSRAKTLTSVRLRAFLTSRPELPIRLGFHAIRGKYQNMVLHEMPKPVIEHDITAYLKDELASIRNEYNSSVTDDRQLLYDWPGQTTIETLVHMAIPLFIFAATVCRFIRERRCGGPDQQLAKILRYQTKSQQSKLDATYLPTLEQQIVGLTEFEKREVINDFRTVVGAIVLLAEPLPASLLAALLGIPKAVIDARLDFLHSVLNIPSNSNFPVRLFHLSFRNFLVDPDKRDINPFWIDEKATHEKIATRCLELLSSSARLRKDICSLAMTGIARTDADQAVIESSLPADVRYACLYWVYHVEQSGARMTESHPAYHFLQHHLLHWLEALALLGKISDSVTMIKGLQALSSPGAGDGTSAFLQDAYRFILNCRSIIDLYPTQVYSSALVFAPENSIIRNVFKDCIPRWISLFPTVDTEWNACLQILEGHGDFVGAVAFSPDGTILASASDDHTVRLWDPETGEEKQTLRGHSGYVRAVNFSPDGMTLASASDDHTIQLWDAKTGEEKQTLRDHSDWVRAVAFSPDGATLASASYDTVRLWDAKTGEEEQALKGHSSWINAVAFSPDGTTLASASDDLTVRLWDTKTGEEKQTLNGKSGCVNAVAFSLDSTTLASAFRGCCVKLWDAKTGEEKQTLARHSSYVNAVAFSPDGATLASASHDCTVQLWDTKTGKWKQALDSYSGCFNAITFSPDSATLASASDDSTIGLWDVKKGKEQQTHTGHSGYVRAITFSPSGTAIASASDDRTIRLWDANTGEEKQTLKGHSNWVRAVTFSPDGATLASASQDCTVRLWDPDTGEEKQTLKGHSGYVRAVTFSPDGTTLASASDDRTVRLWDAKTGEEKQTLQGHSDWVRAVAFSPDGATLASASQDYTVRLWDLETGEEKQTLKGHNGYVRAVTFSPDGTTLASASLDFTVRLWDAKMGKGKQTLKINQVLTSLVFSSDNRYLKTDRGQLKLCSDSTETSLNNDFQTKQYFFSDDWVVQDGQKLLWIPPNFRPQETASHDQTFALGYSSGLVKIIQFASI